MAGMPDNHPEAIKVTVAGKERVLKLGPASFRLAELKHGTTVTMDELQSFNFGTLARVFWVACLPDDPDYTEEAAMLDLAQDPDQMAVMGLMGDLIGKFGEDIQEAFKGVAGKGRRRSGKK